MYQNNFSLFWIPDSLGMHCECLFVFYLIVLKYVTVLFFMTSLYWVFRFSSCVIAAVLISIFQFRIANAMQCYWQFQFQSFTISNYQTLPLTIGHMKQIHFHSFMAIGPSSRPTFRSFCMLLQLAFHAVVPTLLKTHCKFSELNSEENKRMLIIHIYFFWNVTGTIIPADWK